MKGMAYQPRSPILRTRLLINMRLLPALFLLFATATSGAAQMRGVVRDDLTVQSQILGRSVRYSIYLPYDYETSRRSYPVLYLLHGGGGDHTSWIGRLEAQFTLDEAIATRAVPPMIVVMPDAGSSRYMNNHDKTVRYEDFFFSEFIPAIEKSYRANRLRLDRAIGGFSMGGYAALNYAIRRPDMFGAVFGISASLYTDSMTLAMTQEEWDVGRGPTFGSGLAGSARLTTTYRAYDPIHLASQLKQADLQRLGIYLDSGDDDPREEGSAVLHHVLRRRGVAHEYRVRDGGHTGLYARTGLLGALQFIATYFRNVGGA